MKIYQFAVQEGYESAVPEADDEVEIFLGFDGSAKASAWTPIRMELVKEDRGHHYLPSDMPWFAGNAPVLKQPAVDVLSPVLTKDGELLPLACDDANLWVFNVMTVLDALDEDRSEVIRFSNGRIMRVNSFAFRPDRLRRVGAFKVPQLLRSALFVTEEVVARAATLTGVGFKLLWEGDQC